MKWKFTATPFVFHRYIVCSYACSHNLLLMLKATPFVVISKIDSYTVCIPSIYTKGIGLYSVHLNRTENQQNLSPSLLKELPIKSSSYDFIRYIADRCEAHKAMYQRVGTRYPTADVVDQFGRTMAWIRFHAAGVKWFPRS
jgi:hypothetical protein